MIFENIGETLKRGHRPVILRDLVEPALKPLGVAVHEAGDRLAGAAGRLVPKPLGPTGAGTAWKYFFFGFYNRIRQTALQSQNHRPQAGETNSDLRGL